eukprot:4569196-Pyramimonas_sp.AAC.1
MGDTTGAAKYKELAAKKEAEIASHRQAPQVNRAFHDMRTLEGRSSKAVWAYASAPTAALLEDRRGRV